MRCTKQHDWRQSRHLTQAWYIMDQLVSVSWILGHASEFLFGDKHACNPKAFFPPPVVFRRYHKNASLLDLLLCGAIHYVAWQGIPVYPTSVRAQINNSAISVACGLTQREFSLAGVGLEQRGSGKAAAVANQKYKAAALFSPPFLCTRTSNQQCRVYSAGCTSWFVRNPTRVPE